MPDIIRGRNRSGVMRELKVYHDNDLGHSSKLGYNIAKTITSPHNQYLTMLMVGNPGSGKSWAAMDIAVHTAWYVSRILEGKSAPYSHWYKYFNLDNMAIITLDNVATVFDNLQQYNVFILDDIGVGYSARDFNKDKNKIMNKIIQTFRTDNACVIFTVPDKFMIDKVPRSLVERYMEFEKSGSIYSKGINLFRYMNMTNLKRDGKMIYAYQIAQDMQSRYQYVRHKSKRPPNILTEPYEILRRQIALELRESEAEELREIDSVPTMHQNADRDAKRDLEFKQFNEVQALHDSGVAASQACEDVGFAYTMYRRFKSAQRPNWFVDRLKCDNNI